MEPYLYHGIRFNDIDKIINILECGFILPRRMIEDKSIKKNDSLLDFNGERYISLCQKSLYLEESCYDAKSSFLRHILNHACFVIKNNYENIKYTEYLDVDYYGPMYLKKVVYDSKCHFLNRPRVADCPVQS